MTLRGRRLLVEKQHLQRFALLTQLDAFPALYCPLSHVSPRSCSISWHSFSPWHNLSKSVLRMSPQSCCILLFTLQKACYTRSVCLSPAKRLFIVVNVVFVVFPPQQAISERERARLQGSFRSCGEVPLVGAMGGWPVGSPWASPSPLTQGGWQGQRFSKRP